MADTRYIRRERIVEEPITESEGASFKAGQVVYFIFGVISLLLGLRFVFLLFGANPDAGIVSFIYGVTDPLMRPFQGIFPATVAEGAVLSWTVLVAIAIYMLIAYFIVRIIELASTDRTR